MPSKSPDTDENRRPANAAGTTLAQLARRFVTDARAAAMERALQLARSGRPVTLAGLAGSSPSLLLGGMALRTPAPATALPTLVVADDMDAAGYLYKRALGAGIEESGNFAAALSSLKLAKIGPFNGSLADVEEVLASKQTL